VPRYRSGVLGPVAGGARLAGHAPERIWFTTVSSGWRVPRRRHPCI